MWSAFLESTLSDMRFGVRQLTRNRIFAALSVTTLAVGIGAATTIFSVIYNVLLDPFDFNAERIVTFQIRDAAATRPDGRSVFQVPEFLEYQSQIGSFEDVIAGTPDDVVYSTPEGSERFVGGLMSVNNFSFLGVRAELGRTLEPADGEAGAAPVFVATHSTWLRQFGGDPRAVGRSFVLNGVPTTLVGVMSPRFHKLGADVYLPTRLDRADARQQQRFYMLQGRLKRGVTEQQAEAEIRVVAERVARMYPRNYPQRFTVRVVSLIDSVVGSFRTTLYTLGAAVGLLLLIACANVANMLLARATTREREIALRASLGASRARLVRQMLVESLLLSLLGAVLGCVAAHFAIRVVAASIPPGVIPQQAVIQLNAPVVLFSLAAAILTSIACGLVPALRAGQRNIVEPLKDSNSGAGAAFRHQRLGNMLVAAEVALSIVLLVGAGLLVRSFSRLQHVDLGFDPNDLVMARLAVPPAQYRTPAANGELFHRVVERVQAMPGVVAATIMSSPPPFGPRLEIAVPGQPSIAKEYASAQSCSEGYFRTVGVQLLRGRVLNESDIAGSRRVAVVNQTLAEHYFASDEPLGRAVLLTGLAGPAPAQDSPFEIVGVVADTRNQGLREPTLPAVFVPHTVAGSFVRGILVRTAAPAPSLLNALKREVWAVDRSIAVTDTGLVADLLDQYGYAEPRLSVVVMTTFAVVGLVLVAIGVFSVIAYRVSRRTREIGIRMALGAEDRHVIRMILQSTVAVIAAGIIVGICGSVTVTRILSAQLFGITPNDPATMIGVVAIVIVVGLVAAYVPAKRATRVDPLISLRYE